MKSFRKFKRMGCKESKDKEPSDKDASISNTHGNDYQPSPKSTPKINPPKSADSLISGPSNTQDDNRNLYKALFAYDSRSDGDIPFQKGDVMEVTDESDAGWWYAKHLTSGKEGYIPNNFVSRMRSILAEDWYFGAILRNASFKILSEDGLNEGTFLVRDSVSVPGVYVISLRTSKPHEQVKVVNIRVHPTKMEGGGIKYHREESRKFDTLQGLIAYYQENPAEKGNKCLFLTSPTKQAPTTAGLARDTWEISRDAITLEKKLGEGNFGEVWKGTWKNRLTVAVKQMKPGAMDLNEFLEEAETLKLLRHENLLALQGICTTEEPVLIVTEMMVNGDLRKYLTDGEGRFLKVDEMIFMAKQVAAGMRFLEKRNFVHRDLAARNILVGENNHVKVADFGLSRVLDEQIYEATGTKFPVKWSAPEALLERKFSTKSDVWSFGITLTEIETKGKTPYPGVINRDLSRKLEQGFRMPQRKDCPDKLYSVMMSCWKWKPEQRPTFEELFEELSTYLIDIEKGLYT